MLKSPLLFSISFLVTLLSWTSVVKAEVVKAENVLALSFSLPPAREPVVAQNKLEAEQGEMAVATEGDRALDLLSRPQEPLRAISVSSAVKATSALDKLTSDNTAAHKTRELHQGNSSAETKDIGIHFLEDSLIMPEAATDESAPELPNSAPIDISPEQTAQASYSQLIEGTYKVSDLDDWIFEGGSRSLVAHTVGSAEGTRHWNGDRTKAYHGHIDPGNGVWNLGTFSYQHEASSPEDADDKQLRRLKSQGIQLEQQASQKGIHLSLQEKLNGLDLANQAPIAALGKGGYIDRLEQAYRLQLSGEEAIAWARTRSYIDPDTRQWNAPGLGNNLYSISKDQERRMAAIDKALRAYDQADHDGLELAKLERIQLESSGLEGVGLARRTVAKTAFDGVAEEFRLAAHDISLEEIDNQVEPEETLTATAISFDLPDVGATTAVADSRADSPVASADTAITTHASDTLNEHVLNDGALAGALNTEGLDDEILDSKMLDSVANILPTDLPDTLLKEAGDISLTFAPDGSIGAILTEASVASLESVDTEVANTEATRQETVEAKTEANLLETQASEPISFEPAETVLAEEIAAERLASSDRTPEHPTGEITESQEPNEQADPEKQNPTLASLLNGISNPKNESVPNLSSISDSDTAAAASSLSGKNLLSPDLLNADLPNTDLFRIEDKIVYPPASSQ